MRVIAASMTSLAIISLVVGEKIGFFAEMSAAINYAVKKELPAISIETVDVAAVLAVVMFIGLSAIFLSILRTNLSQRRDEE